MTKPIAIAECNDLTGRPAISNTRIMKRRDGAFTFHAPGYVALKFKTLERARAKMEAHPGFVQWVA